MWTLSKRSFLLTCGLTAVMGCSGSVVSDGGMTPDGMAPDGETPDATATPDVQQPPGPATARWVLPRMGPTGGFELPWPNDLTLDAQGFVDFRYVPNTRNTPIVEDYISALRGRIQGFSPVAAVYVRFSGGIDQNSLPANAAASVMASSSVQLIDVDPMSPERGQRRPIQLYYRANATSYWPSNTLAVAPSFGFPLRGRTRYALIVTETARASDGSSVRRDTELDAVLSATPSTDAALERARMTYAPALMEVERAGVQRTSIRSMTVFTTQDPAGEMFRAIDVARTLPVPQVRTITKRSQDSTIAVFEGDFGPVPVFQQGTSPYTSMGQGGFVVDAMGNPQPQGMIDIHFHLTIPVGTEMPAGGWPLAIYAHGTGGDSNSFIGDRTAGALALQGVAVLGFDQIYNGRRAASAGGGSAPEYAFFNFENPIAGRTNNRQAAIDLFMASRFARELRVSAMVSERMQDQTFNASRMLFFGHSQGSLCGPLTMAADPTFTTAVYSGAGSTFNLAIVKKTEPVNIPTALAVLLRIPTNNLEELVALHPVLTMLQTAIDVSDPVNYARYLVRETRMGTRPRNLFLTQGFVDSYSPPDTAAALAMAAGMQLMAPVLHEVKDYPLTGMNVGMFPARGNVAMGMATAVWQQFDAPGRTDGHFVVFNVAQARDRTARFLGSAGQGEQPPIVPAM